MNISVGISDWKVGRDPDTIVTYALGSCVGICLYDKMRKIGGLSHIMLSDSKIVGKEEINRMKFADTAIKDMMGKMLTMGALRTNITAKIAGGAVMFSIGGNDRFNIGERNIVAVRATLQELRIPLIASDTGANYGRTVFFDLSNGSMIVKSATKGQKIL